MIQSWGSTRVTNEPTEYKKLGNLSVCWRKPGLVRRCHGNIPGWNVGRNLLSHSQTIGEVLVNQSSSSGSSTGADTPAAAFPRLQQDPRQDPGRRRRTETSLHSRGQSCAAPTLVKIL